VCVGAHGDPDCARQSKVRELQAATRVDEQVLWLQVAMQDASCVAVRQSLQQLEQVALWWDEDEGEEEGEARGLLTLT